MNDKREIIVHGYKAYYSGRYETTSEISNEEGIFHKAHVTTAHETEEYSVMMPSSYGKLGEVRYLTDEQKKHYFQLQEKANEIAAEKKALLMDASITGNLVTLDWMKKHQRPEIKIPEEFTHKKQITKLRRGSKVIIDSTSSRWVDYVGRTGKIKRFNPKYCLIQLDSGGQMRVPYIYLKPLNPESRQKAKEDKHLAEIGARVVGNMNKVFSKMVKGVGGE